MTATAARTQRANLARRQHTQGKLRQVAGALDQLRRERAPITYPAVARLAGVSRTFLYQNAEAAALIAEALTAAGAQRRRARSSHDAQVEASWRQRALNAEDALRNAQQEIGIQRERIGILLGEIRDLRAEYTHDAAQRVAAENLTLRQRVHQLTDANRELEGKLQAARSNNRFLDKRVADLEAQLLDAAGEHFHQSL